jgi:hypothetical protein
MMAFFLFLLVNAALFLRPAEFIPALQAVSLYEGLIVACLVVSSPQVLQYLTSRPLDSRPITFCVLGLLALVVVSELSRLSFETTLAKGLFFSKIVIYYLLLVSLINTPRRLHLFLAWLVLCGTVLTGLTMLHYHDLIDLSHVKNLTLLSNDLDPLTGEPVAVNRLQAVGIFQDPNELCVLLAALVPLGLYRVATGSPIGRLLWLGPLALFLYAIALTHSRGGFLAFVTGLAVLAGLRFGWRRTALLGTLGLPLVLVAFAGRQTNISANVGTGQTRIQLWSDWMLVFRENPLLGQGMSQNPANDEQGAEGSSQGGTGWLERKHLAHNSYLQGFADLGLAGGTLFLGAFYLALWSVIRHPRRRRDPRRRRFQPYLAGAIAAFAAGLLTLSCCYDLPTYAMLGLAAVFPAITQQKPAWPEARIDVMLLGRLAALSVTFLTVTYAVIRLFVHWA